MYFNKAKKNLYALGRLKTGERNKTEAAYENHLEFLKNAGEIKWQKFEGLKLRLADNTFYTPDFAIMNKFDQIECHEVKGFMLDDANVKIKIAADIYPFVFKLVKAKSKKEGGGWDIKEY